MSTNEVRARNHTWIRTGREHQKHAPNSPRPLPCPSRILGVRGGEVSARFASKADIGHVGRLEWVWGWGVGVGFWLGV